MEEHPRSVQRLLRTRTFPVSGQSFWVGQTQVDGDYRPHDHDFVEIVVITRGTGEHRTVGSQHALCAGDVLIIRPGIWHTYHGCRRLVLYNCCFAAELLDRELLWLMDDPAAGRLLWSGPLHPANQGTSVIHFSPAQKTHCLRELRRLARPRRRTSLEQIGDLLSLLGLLAGALSGDAAAAPAMHPAVTKAAHLLSREYRRHWSLDELSCAVGLHKSYLVRLFHRYTGMPPLSFLNQVRLDRAAAILLQGEQPIGQAAAAVGWDDQNYFARRFRSRFGMTPSQYRRTQREPTTASHGR